MPFGREHLWIHRQTAIVSCVPKIRLCEYVSKGKAWSLRCPSPFSKLNKTSHNENVLTGSDWLEVRWLCVILTVVVQLNSYLA